MTTSVPPSEARGVVSALNTDWHRAALNAFLAIVVLHWVEHIAQAVQIYAFDWPRPSAGGALGLVFPWLVTSELLHYGFAVVMLFAFFLLRRGFSGRARWWWGLALGIQFWHHIEHFLLLAQAWVGVHLLGRPVPTSVIQLIAPRVELHLFYNAVVFIPMVVAMVLHMRRRQEVSSEVPCSCTRTPSRV